MVPSSPETIQDHFQVLISAGIWSLLSSWIAYQCGFYSIGADSKEQKIPLSQLVGIFCLFIVLSVFVIPMIALIGLVLWSGEFSKSAWGLDVPTEGWINVISILVTAAILFGYFFSLPQRTRLSVWRQSGWNGLVRNLMVGIVVWPVCYPIVVAIDQVMSILVQWLQLPVAHHEQLAVGALKKILDFPWLVAALTFLIVFIVPVIEEMLFRGFLQTWLKSALGRNRAILVASLLFASFHFSWSQGFDNLELLLSLFVLSCFLGYVYERQQSLWASIGLHATFNGVSVVAILFGFG